MSIHTINTLTNRIYHATTRADIADLYEELAYAYYREYDRYISEEDRVGSIILAREIAAAYQGKSRGEVGTSLKRELENSPGLRPDARFLDGLCSQASSSYSRKAAMKTLGLLVGVRQN